MIAFARDLTLRLSILEGKHWAATLALATLACLYLLAGLSLFTPEGNDGRALARAVAFPPVSNRLAQPKEAPPVPEPLAFREIAPLDALARNAAIPVSDEPNPAARPFVARGSELDRLRSIDCLTAAVYYEAAIEPVNGQRAVAQVVLNRVRHPAFPKTVCGVVFQGAERATGCQFTFTCDGSLARAPSRDGWKRARKIAEEALAGKVYKPVGYATHYHTNWVVPYWSDSLAKLANVGTHIFYRWEGGWGRPAAFRYHYAGLEPGIGRIGHMSTAHVGTGETTRVATLDDVQAPNDGATDADFAGRTVLRHYEPLRAQAAASSKEGWARTDVPRSLRWALTGETGQLRKAESPDAAAAVVPISGSELPSTPETQSPAR